MVKGVGLTILVATLFGAVPTLGARATTPAQTQTPATCATSAIVVWLDTNGDGAAGSTYFHLNFTNLSSRACTLAGYPGVSAVDLGNRQLGSAAARNPSQAVRVVTLAGGASATAVLRIAAAVNFPSSKCRRVTAAGLRVFPPNQRASKVIPFPFQACSRKGPIYLSVAAVKKA